MSSIEKLLERRRRKTLKAVEEHLKKHPMGETYFCKGAGCNPYVTREIRRGKRIGGEQLDKLNALIRQREKEAVKQRGTQSPEAAS